LLFSAACAAVTVESWPAFRTSAWAWAPHPEWLV
jgi:hypothetical protein